MHAPSQEIGPTGATSELWGLLMQDFYRLDYVTFVSISYNQQWQSTEVKIFIHTDVAFQRHKPLGQKLLFQGQGLVKWFSRKRTFVDDNNTELLKTSKCTKSKSPKTFI